MSKIKVVPLVFDSYIAAIKNSIGAKTYRRLYAKVDGKKTDILKNGDLACAWFVSSILLPFKLIGGVHATVAGAVKDLEKSGWMITRHPKNGDILIWGSSDESKGHRHIGFYVGDNLAVSNDSRLGYPVKRHWTFGRIKGKPNREIEAIYHNRKLNG